MLPLTLGLLVYSLFMRVGCFVCVTLPLIIIHLSLTHVQSVVFILLHTCYGYCWCLLPSLLRDTLSSKVSRQGSTALELDAARNTKIQTGLGCELRNTLRPVWLFVLPQVLMIVWRGSLPALIYLGGQGYMKSPSRVQLESYYNTIGQFPLYCSQFYAYLGSYKKGKVHP